MITPPTPSDFAAADTVEEVRHPHRWRLTRAGIVNVWHYFDTEFVLGGGRMILRGANGSGKSRALEMLLPFLLDAARTRMDATGAGKVDLDDLMRTGAEGSTNRVGYLWLELTRHGGSFTIGAHLRYSASAHRCEVSFFTTELAVGSELLLMDEQRTPLSRDELAARIGADRMTTDPERHREVVRTEVFGLGGATGRDRYAGLLQLLHTLRAPDVGNRIDEGRLPQILSDALPPLTENLLVEAGSRLDLLDEDRREQERLESVLGHVDRFHTVYRDYATDLVRGGAREVLDVADRVAATRQEWEVAAAEAEDLTTQSAAAETRLRERSEQLTELDRALRGLESHAVFGTADDLAQRSLTVDALARAAEHALVVAGHARVVEQREADAALLLIDELTAVVARTSSQLSEARVALTTAGVDHTDLPSDLRMQLHPAAHILEPVRTETDSTPVAHPRPALPTVDLTPSPMIDACAAAERVVAAASHKRSRVTRRLLEARRLEYEARGVRDAESIADHAEVEAERLAGRHEQALTTLRETAGALRSAWSDWITDERTRALLPVLGERGAALVQRLGAHLDNLVDDERTDFHDDSIVTELEELPAAAVRAALVPAPHIGTEVVPDDEDRALRAGFAEEYAALEAEECGPRCAPWHTRSDGVPLWQAVDFADSLGDDDRAGIEAGLLAAGFLTATIDSEGRLRAQSGQVLVSPRHSPPAQSLSMVLHPVEGDVVPVSAIAAVLSTIGFEDAGAVASVSRDGRWHNGVLRGRHAAETARYIGHRARNAETAARRTRLDEIRGELARLDLAEATRRLARDAARSVPAGVDAVVSSAPGSGPLTVALTRVRETADHARLGAARAEELRSAASSLRARWSTEVSTHRGTCARFDVPADAAELDALAEVCARAEAACGEVVRGLAETSAARARLDGAVARVTSAAADRVAAEETAEEFRHVWHTQAAAVAAQSEIANLEAVEVAGEIRATETERARVDEQLRRTLAHREALVQAVAEARERCAAARERFEQQRSTLTEVTGRVSEWLRIPEIRSAVVHHDVMGEVGTSDDPGRAAGWARVLLDVLPESRPDAENEMLSALQRFDRAVSERFTVEHTVDEGAHVVRLRGQGGERTPSGVLASLTSAVEAGRVGLSQRERDVFTGFVLGGVADELRRRVEQAETLVDAMNAALEGSRTTHGIGVRIAWRPMREDPEAARLTELITSRSRSGADAEDLVELLRKRVDASYADDPTTGFATHLERALDYRLWHSVDVTILGPEPDRERRISTRAKISQGETRFVSYVALFAAADAYLSGLPDPERALRLVLLDDAFAKIDDRTIGELMGLLVRQDIDFVMTGHALWGCSPAVPELDIYEVRRLEGGAAVTTRVRWDGRVRHPR